MADFTLPSNHAGLVFPLDMFRPTLLAAAMGEALVAQVRNILDAKLELIRHPEVQLVLGRITGSVVGDDPATFWRENPELGMVASQVLPRQVFVYWVQGEPEARQGFIVAQRGQVLAAQDATRDQLPPEATDADWPVAQLLAQLQLHPEEGGPSIEISLVDHEGDDRELLMTLAGQPPEGGQASEGGELAGGEGAEGQPAAAAPGSGQPKRSRVEDDQKRRAAEHQAEREARRAKADSIRSDLPHVIDDVGAVVAPRETELADADILSSYLTRAVAGDIPAGLPRELHEQLQGKRVDFAVPVEFLSEVFYGEGPLTKATFEAKGEARTIGGVEVKVLEVLGPRLGRGTLIRRDRAGVFVSRTPDMALPEELIVEILSPQQGG